MCAAASYSHVHSSKVGHLIDICKSSKNIFLVLFDRLAKINTADFSTNKALNSHQTLLLEGWGLDKVDAFCKYHCNCIVLVCTH